MRNSTSEGVLCIVREFVFVTVNEMELAGVGLMVYKGSVLGAGSAL